MRLKVLAALLIVTLCFSALIMGCSKDSTVEDIKITVVGPMTGNSAQWGQSMKEGIGLAAEEINSKGGVLGKKISIVYEDDKGDPKEAVSVAQRISNDDKVTGIIGPLFTSCTMAASPVFQKAKIPEIAVASTQPAATSAGDYICRINVTYTHQGAGMIKWVVEEQKKQAIAMIFVNDDYGNGIAKIAREKAKELGATIVYEDSIAPSGEQDFTVLLTKAKAAKPDVLVLFTYYAAAGQIVIQANRLGINTLIVGCDGLYSSDFVSLAGKDAEGIFVATWFHPGTDTKETKDFTEAYRKKYNRETDTWAPYAYDALYCFADAIKRAGKVDRTAIRDSLAQTKNFIGATGVTTFTSDRVPDAEAKKLIFTKIIDGKYVTD